MIKKSLLSVILALTCSTVFSQNASTVQPAKPTADETIRVAYHPKSNKASIKKADSLKLYALFWPAEGDPVFKQFMMVKNGNKWQTNINPENTEPVFIQYKFVSGKLDDNNNSKFWDIPIYNRKVRPVLNAYLRMGDSYDFFGELVKYHMYNNAGMFRSRNIGKATAYYKKAWQRDSANVEAAKKYLFEYSYKLQTGSKGKSKAQIKKEGLKKTDAFVKQISDLSSHPKALATAVYTYNRYGNKSRSDSLRSILFEKYYHTKAARLQRYYQVFNINSGSSKITYDSTMINRAKAYLTDYPQAHTADQITYQILLPAMVKQARGAEAFSWLNERRPRNSESYARLADLMMNSKNVDSTLALTAAGKAYDLSKQFDPGSKPPFAAPGEWQKVNGIIKKREKAQAAHTYAQAYLLNGQIHKAEPYAKQAYKLREASYIPYNATYVHVLLKNGKYRQAVKEGQKAVAKNKANDKLIGDLKKAFQKSRRSDADFNKFLSEAKRKSTRSLQKRLRDDMIKEKAPDFRTQSLQGKGVSLHQFEGKVVVLDFWNRGCGPCVSSFPDYQKVVDHFKDNDKVVFWAIDAWGGVINKKRTKGITNFMKKHGWTFPVLLDDDNNKVTNKYGVIGIPTQFMLDKQGNIRFKKVGYSGASMKQDMIVKINMLLKGKIASGNSKIN